MRHQHAHLLSETSAAGCKTVFQRWRLLWGDQKWKSYVPALTREAWEGVCLGLTEALHFTHVHAIGLCWLQHPPDKASVARSVICILLQNECGFVCE